MYVQVRMKAIRASKVNRAAGPLDFSLLTDGLRAEREQGITIDVAYRHFSTPRRKFIVRGVQMAVGRRVAVGRVGFDLLVSGGRFLLRRRLEIVQAVAARLRARTPPF